MFHKQVQPSTNYSAQAAAEPADVRKDAKLQAHTFKFAAELDLISSDDPLGEAGRFLSQQLMPEVAAKHPGDTVVMFLVESGTYITAKDDTALLDKYEALHHDEWGWVTDIVRGPGDTSEGVGRP